MCRAFDQLQSGQEYETALPVHHIGFLDYTLFKEVPEFYATYRLMNEKNHHIYSSKFILSVLNLTCIELATEDDKAYKIDYWARLFKAKTWEEIQMVAKENEYLEETAKRLFAANADEIVRQKCLARQDAERRERTLERDNKLLKKALADKDAEIARLQSIINDMKQTNI